MLRFRSLSLFVFGCGLVSGAAAFAQISSPQTPLAATAQGAVPALVPYSGVVIGTDGKPESGEISITFLIFKDEQGGESLWTETQSVGLSDTGHYKVELGASNPSGLPQDLFSTGEARWLEVQVAGHQPQARVLLASVPYSMKAADAATLGGLPASAFLRADDLKTAAASLVSAVPLATPTANAVTTTGGTAGFVPSFSGAAAIGNSEIFDTGTSVGIGDQPNAAAKLDVNGATILRGGVQLSRTGNASAGAAANSYGFDFYTQAYNSATGAAVNPYFQWQGEASGNNSASPGATMNLLYSNGSGLAETGLYFNGNGTIHFAPGQTFPGAGGGTISKVTAGTDLTGGGTSGNVTLNVDTTKVVTSVAAGTGLTGGGTGGKLTLAVDPTQVPLLGGSNTFAGNMTVGGQLIAGNGNIAGGLVVPVSQNRLGPAGVFGSTSYPLDMQASANSLTGQIVPQDFRLLVEPAALSNAGASSSLSVQYAANGGSPGETGISFNPNGTINGAGLSLSKPAGTQATPVLTVQADENGVSRNAATQLVVEGSTFPGDQLLMGFVTDPVSGFSGGYATIQATVTGAFNTALMLQPNGGCVCIATGNAWPYSNPLIVGQGQGSAIADGWSTYSSRRFKADIHTLSGALDKVEQLRGVSYTLKATGKREIGVIAEEVGKVVPEVVTYEKNGVDAQSVDYTRLTALLIEATKQQQAEIAKQQRQIADALREIKVDRMQLHRQAASLVSLKAQVRAASKAHQADWELASGSPNLAQPVRVAAK